MKTSVIFFKENIFLTFTSLLLSSCDIAGMIAIKNSSGGDATYRYYVQSKKDSVNITEVKMRIRSKNKGYIPMGLGYSWQDSTIREYLKLITKIEITTNKDTVQLTDQEEMFEFFRERRKGSFRQLIKIKIK